MTDDKHRQPLGKSTSGGRFLTNQIKPTQPSHLPVKLNVHLFGEIFTDWRK